MYRKTILSNGLRIVTHDMKERESVSLGFWIAVGGRHEEDKIKGAAHFLEHIAFKGSAKYSCDEIKELIEGVGGTLNAFTGEEQTCFYAKIPSKYFIQTFDILADMVFFPKIDQKDVAREGSVIVEEIKMYRDLPQYYVLEILDELLWPDHPLGKNLAGTPETVSAMTHKELRQFHRTHYGPSNTVIAVAGRLRHDQIVALAEKRLIKISKSKPTPYLLADNKQDQTRYRFFEKKTEQMHLALGMLGFDEHHKDRYGLNLLSIILGGNMSSRLFNELREKRGLAYSVSSSAKCLHDTGVFVVRAGIDIQRLEETTELILKEFDKVKKEGVTEGEFTRAKDYLIGQIQLSLEDSMDHMLWLGEQVISKNKVQSIKTVIRELAGVKRDDLVRIAGEIIQQPRFNLALVGPLSSQQEKGLSTLLSL